MGIKPSALAPPIYSPMQKKKKELSLTETFLSFFPGHGGSSLNLFVFSTIFHIHVLLCQWLMSVFTGPQVVVCWFCWCAVIFSGLQPRPLAPAVKKASREWGSWLPALYQLINDLLLELATNLGRREDRAGAGGGRGGNIKIIIIYNNCIDYFISCFTLYL